MNSELIQGWLRVALFILLTAIALLFFVTPGTAEYVITVASVILGLVFTGVILVIIYLSKH